MASWFDRKKEATTHPVDTRLEIVSDGLSQAAVELQNFVTLLKKRYEPKPQPEKEGK